MESYSVVVACLRDFEGFSDFSPKCFTAKMKDYHVNDLQWQNVSKDFDKTTFPVTIVTKSEKVTSLRKSHVSRLSEHGVTKRVMIHKMEIEAVPTETRTGKEGEEIQSNRETRKLNVPLKASLRGRQNFV